MAEWKNKNTVLTAGFAQIPKGTTLYEVSTMVGCVLIIDADDGVICDASFTFVMDKTSEFLVSLLVGKSVAGGCRRLRRRSRSVFSPPARELFCRPFVRLSIVITRKSVSLPNSRRVVHA